MNPMRHDARRRWLRWFVAGVSAALSIGSVHGYDASTHSILSTRAAQRSILYTDTSLLADWGFGSPYTETFNSLDFTARQIDALVAAGSEHEDNLSQIKRVYNHFFDPQFNSYAGRGLYALSGAVTGHRSSDWALEETQELVSIPALLSAGSVPQEYSFRNGQHHFYNALTLGSPTVRRQELGQAFQTLGHVIHHLQDMAQPQHTRNDSHSPVEPTSAFYENYTKEKINPTLVASYLLDSNPYNQGFLPSFTTAREFWGQAPVPGPRYRGMADFSAHNYVTFGTNYGANVAPNGAVTLIPPAGFPLPTASNRDGTQRTLVSIPTPIRMLAGHDEVRTIDYVVGKVYDEVTDTYTDSRLFAAASLLDPHLTRRGRTKTLAMNYQVFNSHYPVLFPRAVAFSSAMINHFFRGKLGLARSGTGTDWVISNLGTQQMSGSFSIFRDDASGTRTLAGGPWTRTVAAGGSTTVTLSEPPVGTTKLIAVFRGQIGAEGSVSSDFYAVAGKSIPYTQGCSGQRRFAGGIEGLDTTFPVGSTAGTVQAAFEAFGQPDRLVIKSGNGNTLATTTTFVSGYHTFNINYNPASLGSTSLRVEVTGSEEGTAWNLVVGCPGEDIGMGLDRMQVVFHIGAPLTNANGSCTAQMFVNGVSAGTAFVSQTGGTTKTILMTVGATHQVQFTNFSCAFGTQNIGTTVRYTDGAGTHSAGNMASPLPTSITVIR